MILVIHIWISVWIFHHPSNREIQCSYVLLVHQISFEHFCQHSKFSTGPDPVTWFLITLQYQQCPQHTNFGILLALLRDLLLCYFFYFLCVLFHVHFFQLCRNAAVFYLYAKHASWGILPEKGRSTKQTRISAICDEE